MEEPIEQEDRTEPAEGDARRHSVEWFRRRLRDKLAARGLSGEALERQVDALMMRDIGFRFDLDGIEPPSPGDTFP